MVGDWKGGGTRTRILALNILSDSLECLYQVFGAHLWFLVFVYVIIFDGICLLFLFYSHVFVHPYMAGDLPPF